MKCERCAEKVIDLIDEELSDLQQARIEEHLDECNQCRQKYEGMSRADEEVRTCLSQLAPAGRHLTDQRLEKLEEKFDPGKRIFTTRRMAGAGMAATILVIAMVFGSQLTGPSKNAVSERSAKTETNAGVRENAARVQVQFSPLPGETGGVVRGYVRTDGEVPADNILRTTTPGAMVPVEKATYDSEEDAYWW